MLVLCKAATWQTLISNFSDIEQGGRKYEKEKDSRCRRKAAMENERKARMASSVRI